jgi:hypothetical protein
MGTNWEVLAAEISLLNYINTSTSSNRKERKTEHLKAAVRKYANTHQPFINLQTNLFRI